MFAFNFIERIQSCVLQCSVRHNRLKQFRIMKKPLLRNPGVNRQKKLIENDEHENFDPSELDDLETDFMNLDKTHKELEREVDAFKEKQKLKIVGRKYFKETQPNFLTWSDKEQMKYLHRTDPEEWTVEKLSEGFPALPEVVHKIIKSNWTKANENKIKNHDVSVEENWKLFRERKLDLPPRLIAHLKKFTNRKLNFKPFETPQKPEKNTSVTNTRKINEFSNIILSYEALKKAKHSENSSKAVENLSLPEKSEENNENILSPTWNTRDKSVTLPELKGRLEAKVVQGLDVTEEELHIIRDCTQNVNEVVDLEKRVVHVAQYHQKCASIVKTSPQEDYSHLQYPQKITIPVKLVKSGCTYKLNDCFYDHTGVFMYRVPGMY